MRNIGRLIFTALILATVTNMKPVFAQNSQTKSDSTYHIPSDIDLDDLPPGTSINWKRVEVFQKTHFWVPSDTLCSTEQKLNKSTKGQIYVANCKYDGVTFTINWGGTDFRPINTREEDYKAITESKNLSVYELEWGYEAKYSSYRCLGKIKNQQDLILWAVMNSTAENAEDVQLVKDIFLQIKKSNSSPSVMASSQP